MWGALLITFVAAMGALLGLVAGLGQNLDLLGRFIRWGGLNMASVLLLAVNFVLVDLAYVWLAHACYIGSYVQVFYEEARADVNLKWPTLLRGMQHPSLKTFKANHAGSFALTTLFLARFALLPSLIGLLVVNHAGLSTEQIVASYTTSPLLAALLFAAYVPQALLLACIPRKQAEIAPGWRRERIREQGTQDRPVRDEGEGLAKVLGLAVFQPRPPWTCLVCSQGFA